MQPFQNPRQGSALLIVLGLISFLLISAVAFSISMRTESSAAAAYRRSLLARELLATTFADARITLDHALTTQRRNASPAFDRYDPTTYTVEALAPFKHSGADKYGRLISSRTTESDASVAGLLDDKVMRHVPPYIATTVYEVLESGEADYDSASTTTYNINSMAEWLPIYAVIPENRIAQGNSNYSIGETVVGRMAWAVINLSDSLDINAIGSNSAYRGLGFTASEFAFDTVEANPPPDALQSWFMQNEDPANSLIELPTFCSNADLAQYAAQRTTSVDLVLKDGDFSPFSWENAIATFDDGFYSPFSVYSFWPNVERKSESGDRINFSSGNSAAGTIDPARRIACNTVTEDTLATENATVADSLTDLVQTVMMTSGAESVGSNFARMLLDYIDKDSVPSDFGMSELSAFSQPAVENTPMIAEVSFDHDGWNKTAYPKQLNEAIKAAIEDMPIFEPVQYETLSAIPDHLDVDTLELRLAIPSQTVGYRAYFPGFAESNENYSIEIDPSKTIVSVLGSGDKAGTAFPFEEGAQPDSIKSTSFSIDVSPSSGELFTKSPMITMEGNSEPVIKIKGEHILVATPADGQTEVPEQEAKVIRLTFLIDFLFRVQVSNSSGEVVDMAPMDNASFGDLGANLYPKTMADRLDPNHMSRIDAQYFRVTRAVAVEFALYWEIQKNSGANGNPPTYTATLRWVKGLDPRTPDENLTAEATIGGTSFKAMDQATSSLYGLSPTEGAWFTVDPRYNWLSPMLGLSDGNFSAYLSDPGDGTPMPKISSPHWLFFGGKNLTTGTEFSSVQEGYEEAHQDIVPFSWGLTLEDIRYGYNDAGQMLLPDEVGFLPVPMNSDVLTPNQSNYCTISLSDYHQKVARGSFFRSLPITDLRDSVFTEEMYKRYGNLASIFKGLEGKNFPEEHRGIVNVFAGQDNYLLAQRLRQFAMLGIPPTIKQAAYVTRERLRQAIEAKRIAPEMLSQDLQALMTLDLPAGLKPPKYDTFIREFLFPMPNDDTAEAVINARDWNRSQPLYGSVQGTPTRPKTLDFIMEETGANSFADRLKAYNQDANASAQSGRLGQNDMTTLLALSKECFGDRQQLFLFILRADAIRHNPNQALSQHIPLSTARAVALVWRDAYGELPDRVIYYQYIP